MKENIKEDLINLVHASSLWPRDEVIQYARVWVHDGGKEFLNLSSSQTLALWQSVCRTTTLADFRLALEEFLTGNPEKGKRGVEERGKRNTPWVRGPGEPLTQKLRAALEEVEKATTQANDVRNEVYSLACETLGDECPSRGLEIRVDFLKALLLLHRSQENYPFQQEES